MENVSPDKAGRDRFEGLRDGGLHELGAAEGSRDAELGAADADLEVHSRESDTVEESTAPTAETLRRGLYVGASSNATARQPKGEHSATDEFMVFFFNLIK